MPYLGSPPKSGFISNAKERYTGITTAYVDLSQSISSLADVIVWVNFVKQDSTNLTLTTSTRITLGATLVSSDIVEVAYLGKAVATQTPGTGAVTNDMLAGSITKDKTNFVSTSSSAGLEIKGDSTTDGTLQLNCSQNSHGVKIKSPAHSASQSYTLTLPTTSPSADKFLKTDGSGNLSFAEAGGGELVFIDKNISTSGGTYATMDNVFSSTYQNYVAHIGLSTSVENDVFFNYRVGTSGSTSLSEDTSYKYAGITARSNEATSTSNYGNNGDKVQITHGSNANDNRLSAFTATMYFYTPYSTSFMARSTYTYFYQNSSAVVSGGAGGILYGYLTAPKTGFSFYTSGGTIDEINIRVYGIKDN